MAASDVISLLQQEVLLLFRRAYATYVGQYCYYSPSISGLNGPLERRGALPSLRTIGVPRHWFLELRTLVQPDSLLCLPMSAIKLRSTTGYCLDLVEKLLLWRLSVRVRLRAGAAAAGPRVALIYICRSCVAGSSLSISYRYQYTMILPTSSRELKSKDHDAVSRILRVVSA